MPALQTLRDPLQTKNDALSAVSALLSQARGKRDELLSTGDGSIVNTALLAKNYLGAAFGRSSQIYKDVAALPFKRAQK